MVILIYVIIRNRSREAFRWFMEFSCDSYEWVMTQNVLDMNFLFQKVKQ